MRKRHSDPPNSIFYTHGKAYKDTERWTHKKTADAKKFSRRDNEIFALAGVSFALHG